MLNTCCRVEFMQGCSGGPRGQSYGDTLLMSSPILQQYRPLLKNITHTHNSMTHEYKPSCLYSATYTYAAVFDFKRHTIVTLDPSTLYSGQWSPAETRSLYFSTKMFSGQDRIQQSQAHTGMIHEQSTYFSF